MPGPPSRLTPRLLTRTGVILALGLASRVLPACGADDEGGGPTNTGQRCTTADQCYPGVQSGELLGDAVCIDRVEGGYCTHECTQDTDCCSAAGECAGNRAEVCAPLESMAGKHCFLSCEKEDLDAARVSDGDVYCQDYANAAFHCRSTGGGSDNRKVCLP